jgi:ABC-type glycerol-3-phosphate transport system substrate-binding protein
MRITRVAVALLLAACLALSACATSSTVTWHASKTGKPSFYYFGAPS